MPELPDVEGFRRELARELPGRRVRRVDVHDSGVLRLRDHARPTWTAEADPDGQAVIAGLGNPRCQQNRG